MVGYFHAEDVQSEHAETGTFKKMRRMLQNHGVRKAHALLKHHQHQPEEHRRHLDLMPSWLVRSHLFFFFIYYL